MRKQIGLVLISACFLMGCSSVKVQDVVTPARVQTVVSLGAFYGARTAILQGHRDKIEAAQAALAKLDASPEKDWLTIAAALKAGGLTFLESGEGSLMLEATAAVFSDEYGPDKILDTSYGKAVVAGALRGVTAALESYPVSTGLSRSVFGWEARLLEEAKATRPSK